MGFLVNHVCSDAVHGTVCGCYVHRVPGWITAPFLGVHTALGGTAQGTVANRLAVGL